MEAAAAAAAAAAADANAVDRALVMPAAELSHIRDTMVGRCRLTPCRPRLATALKVIL